jgi:aminocarboxymuconate-semialdehyde decarboxylase
MEPLMAKPLVIDFHAHMLEKHVLERAQGKTVLTGFGTRAAPIVEGPKRVAMFEKMLDPAVQIEDMDRRGVDVHVISSSTVIQGTSWADPRTELDLVRRINDCAAAWSAAYPRRYVGSFVLPLQDTDLSLVELARAVGELKLKVANVSSSYGGFYLGHPRFHPFWDAVVRADATVFIHPEGVQDLWFQDFGLWNSVGQPIEEAKVMASIIYEGIFDKYPGVKIVMAHGGGFLPHYFGRLDRNVTNMPESAKNISRKPSDYLRSFYYDTCTYGASIAEALIARVGADRLVMGSDYAVGDPDPIASVKAVATITERDLPLVIGGTAARLLGLSAQ